MWGDPTQPSVESETAEKAAEEFQCGEEEEVGRKYFSWENILLKIFQDGAGWPDCEGGEAAEC